MLAVLLCLLLRVSWQSRANLLNGVIDEIFAKSVHLPQHTGGNRSETLSYVEGLCSNLVEPEYRLRLACCSSINGGIMYLHNVQFRNNRIIFYSAGSEAHNLDGSSRVPPATLPVINSIVRRRVKELQLGTEIKHQDFTVSNCTSYFDGTLHVFGRQTTQNLYHVLNDNILPLLTHMVFDAHLRPEWLTAPRAILTGFHPPPDKEQVPHLEAILRAAFPQQFALGSAIEGACFRRVAWGGGVKVMYQHLLGAVRREAAALLRQLVLQAFHPPNPYKFNRGPASKSSGGNSTLDGVISGKQSGGGAGATVPRSQHGQRRAATSDTSPALPQPAAAGSKATLPAREGFFATLWNALLSPARGRRRASDQPAISLTVPSAAPGRRRPLNVVIYTRGSSGVGRTIAGEDALRDRLNALGAHALVCCDFSAVSLAQQLGYAVHADVVMGLHGAGLVNSILAPEGVITLELKTIYGYALTLFALAAEARQGIFIELDIRDYHIWGAPGQSRNRPVDDALIGRVVQALEKALQHRTGAERNTSRGSFPGKAESYPSRMANTFADTMFIKLPRPAAQRRPAIAGGKVLSGGDLMVLPYPTAAWEQLGDAHPRHLDFQLHVLGPAVAEAAAQCEAMALSAYWTYVGERGVKEKYCLTC